MFVGVQGYAKANTTADGLETLKWGTDYLLRTLAKQTKAGQRYPEYNIAYQVHFFPTPEGLSSFSSLKYSLLHVLGEKH